MLWCALNTKVGHEEWRALESQWTRGGCVLWSRRPVWFEGHAKWDPAEAPDCRGLGLVPEYSTVMLIQ
jgi:hypothetical protein